LVFPKGGGWGGVVHATVMDALIITIMLLGSIVALTLTVGVIV
jgi:hypothetical protein